MVALGVILIILALFCYWVEMFFANEGLLHFIGGIFVSLAVITGICLIGESTEEKKPEAIDVYKGKTTLQITYEDSIPIDTVIVFKKEYIK